MRTFQSVCERRIKTMGRRSRFNRGKNYLITYSYRFGILELFHFRALMIV